MHADRRDHVLVQLRVVLAAALLAVGVAVAAWPLGVSGVTSGLWLQVLVGAVLGVVGARELTQLLQR